MTRKTEEQTKPKIEVVRPEREEALYQSYALERLDEILFFRGTGFYRAVRTECDISYHQDTAQNRTIYKFELDKIIEMCDRWYRPDPECVATLVADYMKEGMTEEAATVYANRIAIHSLTMPDGTVVKASEREKNQNLPTLKTIEARAAIMGAKDLIDKTQAN